jgi:hypothetical protein
MLPTFMFVFSIFSMWVNAMAHSVDWRLIGWGELERKATVASPEHAARLGVIG